jgi:mono/diheme cytochrome c family protein
MSRAPSTPPLPRALARGAALTLTLSLIVACDGDGNGDGRGASPPQRPPSEAPAPGAAGGPSGLPPVGAVVAPPAQLGLGRPADPALIAAWDIDVGPEGKELPPGQGSVAEGQGLYPQCIACHGPNGEGGIGPQLVGPTPKTGFGDDFKDHPRTIGNWWTHPTTLFDYIRRAMPQHAPGSLTDAQTYALTAYLLHKNGLVDVTFVADAQSLPTVKMGAQVQFLPDDRDGHDRVR